MRFQRSIVRGRARGARTGRRCAFGIASLAAAATIAGCGTDDPVTAPASITVASSTSDDTGTSVGSEPTADGGATSSTTTLTGRDRAGGYHSAGFRVAADPA
jgi:hypothetical protein